MAGSERSGPLAATCGALRRPSLGGHPARSASARRPSRWSRQLVALCGAVPVRLSPEEHDRAVARTSHVPHLLAVAGRRPAGRRAGAAPRAQRPGRPRRDPRGRGRPGALRPDRRPRTPTPCSACSARCAGELDALIAAIATRRPRRPRRAARAGRRRHPGDPGQARRSGPADRVGLRLRARPPRRAGPAVRRRGRERGQHRGRPHRPRPGRAVGLVELLVDEARADHLHRVARIPRLGDTPVGCGPVNSSAHPLAPGLVVAVDGTSGSGKSSTSRGVADRLGLRYLDTGAMFRAMTWWLLRTGVDVHDPAAVAARCGEPTIVSGTDPLAPTITVDGTDVAVAIRSDEVNARGLAGQRRARGARPAPRAPARRDRRGVRRRRDRRRGPRHRLRRRPRRPGQALHQRRPGRPRRAPRRRGGRHRHRGDPGVAARARQDRLRPRRPRP